MEERWISILDYAKEMNTSISTIRRHIKSGKIQSRMADGKYYIYTICDSSHVMQKVGQSEELEKRVELLQRDVEDLQTLVSLYEMKFGDISISRPKKKQLPSVPIL